MASSADIEAMLAAVEANQVRCPLCGATSPMFFVQAQWMVRPVHFPLTGGAIAYDDEEYSNLPSELDAKIPQYFVCEATDHRPDTPYGPYWFEVPDDVVIDFQYEDPIAPKAP